MRISRIHIKGFRSLGDVQVTLTNYSSLIGRNDSGKSSFLHALHILFDKDRTPCESDTCKIGGHSGETFIQATLAGCAGHEDLTVNNEIQIRRICRSEKWVWEVLCQVPKEEILRKMQAGTLTRTE